MIPPDARTPDARPPEGRRRLRADDLVRLDLRPVLRGLGRSPPEALRVGEDLLPVTWTASVPGGRQRPWASCPRCARPVAVLWALRGGARFACGRCMAVRYATDSMSPAGRLRRRAWRIRSRLGERVGPFAEWSRQGFRPVPPRPRGMWRRTYALLVAELREVEAAGASPRSGRPAYMRRARYEQALARMAGAPDGGAVDAAVENLSRTALALRRPKRGSEP